MNGENIPAPPSRSGLRGHDVDTVVDEDLAGATDVDIRAEAASSDRLHVTLDWSSRTSPSVGWATRIRAGRCVGNATSRPGDARFRGRPITRGTGRHVAVGARPRCQWRGVAWRGEVLEDRLDRPLDDDDALDLFHLTLPRLVTPARRVPPAAPHSPEAAGVGPGSSQRPEVVAARTRRQPRLRCDGGAVMLACSERTNRDRVVGRAGARAR